MKAYVCVYRHYWPTNSQRKKTLADAKRRSDSVLQEFVVGYATRFRFFDWGDDPSFYSAQVFLGDIRHATWGVCRRNIRSQLTPGDLVAFFCTVQDENARHIWDYYYIGFGTVDRIVEMRQDLWTDNELVAYRRYYNVLTELRDGVSIQKEYFHPYHKDWELRSSSPYVFFAPEPSLTNFDLNNPLHVARYDGSQIPEKWNSKAKKLERLLFIKRGIRRRLRTSPTGFAHPPINLATTSRQAIDELRNSLAELSKVHARAGKT